MSESNQAIIDDGNLEKIRSVGGDKLLFKMITLFVESVPKHLSAAEKAIQTADGKQLHQAVHAIKSSACNFGAAPLVALATSIERDAEEHFDRAIETYVQFRTVVDQLKTELSDVRQRLS